MKNIFKTVLSSAVIGLGLLTVNPAEAQTRTSSNTAVQARQEIEFIADYYRTYQLPQYRGTRNGLRADHGLEVAYLYCEMRYAGHSQLELLEMMSNQIQSRNATPDVKRILEINTVISVSLAEDHICPYGLRGTPLTSRN